MVLYFSGTGNSKYVAERIANSLGDTLLSMNDRIKSCDTSPIDTGENVVVVVPTYAWRIPRIVYDWLTKTELSGACRAWFVMTCGSEIGNADKYNRILCRELNIECMGTVQVTMPENYIAMFSAPQADEARKIVAAAEPVIDSAADSVRRGCAFSPCRNSLYDRFMSAAVNTIFYPCFVRADAFTVSDSCIGCGRCAALCPENNITLRGGKPEWGKSCTHCMACICRCPTSAVEYGKKSIGKVRYSFESL